MKAISKISFVTLVISFIAISNAIPQNKVDNKKQPRSKVAVLKNKNHHFRKTKIYHPYWALKASFRHRWVYFPGHNFYWDNYRNFYVIRTGTVWVTAATTPKELENFDFSKEKKIELSEDNDTMDSIQNNNAEHQSEYKVK